MLGYHGKCPVQESHCDVLQAEPGPVGSLTELCLHAAPGHLTSGRKAGHLCGLRSSGMQLCQVTRLPLRPTTAYQGGQGMSKGQGGVRDRTEEPCPWRGHAAPGAPAGARAEGLTCTPRGSVAGPGPGPRVACATRAAARSGREAGAAPPENRAAGAGHQGAGARA